MYYITMAKALCKVLDIPLNFHYYLGMFKYASIHLPSFRLSLNKKEHVCHLRLKGSLLWLPFFVVTLNLSIFSPMY